MAAFEVARLTGSNAIARCNVAGRGENGHWQTRVLIVAGVALVAEFVDDAQTLAVLVESNTENEFKVNIVLPLIDKYLLYPYALGYAYPLYRLLTLNGGCNISGVESPFVLLPRFTSTYPSASIPRHLRASIVQSGILRRGQSS